MRRMQSWVLFDGSDTATRSSVTAAPKGQTRVPHHTGTAQFGISGLHGFSSPSGAAMGSGPASLGLCGVGSRRSGISGVLLFWPLRYSSLTGIPASINGPKESRKLKYSGYLHDLTSSRVSGN